MPEDSAMHGCRVNDQRHADLDIRCALGLGDVVGDVRVVANLNGHLDHIETHLCDVLGRGAVVSGAHIALEGILQQHHP